MSWGPAKILHWDYCNGRQSYTLGFPMSQNLSCRQLTRWLCIWCSCQVENAGTLPRRNCCHAGTSNLGLMGYYPGNSSTGSMGHRSPSIVLQFKISQFWEAEMTFPFKIRHSSSVTFFPNFWHLCRSLYTFVLCLFACFCFLLDYVSIC